METNIPDATDTIQVNHDIHFEQIANVCGINFGEIKSLNPQYKRYIIPGNSKPQSLRLPLNEISKFIDNQDSIYAYRRDELLSNRRTIAVPETQVVSSRPSKRSRAGRNSRATSSHTIRQGETLSTIAQKYGVSVKEIKRWNKIRGNNITAGKRLKIQK